MDSKEQLLPYGIDPPNFYFLRLYYKMSLCIWLVVLVKILNNLTANHFTESEKMRP